MNELIERQLTAIEIKQRQIDHLRLLTEVDNYQSEVDEHRRCIKESATEIDRLQQRERELRRELRSGTVFEPRQQGFALEFQDTERERPRDPGNGSNGAGIDGMRDEPDPETDPPDPVMSLSGPPLDAQALLHLVKCVRPSEFWPTLKEVESWHQDVRTRVQDWCRIEHAHAHPIAGVTLPERGPLPNVLAALEFPHPRKSKGARPLTSKARKGKGTK